MSFCSLIIYIVSNRRSCLWCDAVVVRSGIRYSSVLTDGSFPAVFAIVVVIMTM